MMNLQPRKMSKDYAYYELKKKILEGDIKPNQDLVEGRIADELSISKTPLREALQRLEAEELVIRQPNGRLKTASITVKEAEELFIARSYLEGIIAHQAAVQATAEDIDLLTSDCEKISQAIRYYDEEAILYYGKIFHERLYKISDNRTVVKILQQLNDHVTRYRRLIPIHKKDVYQKGNEDHAKILQFIEERNGVKAEETMRNHILGSMDTAINVIKKYESKFLE